MYLTPNFLPAEGSQYAADYKALLELYTANFNQPVERPLATYWAHTIVPEYFRLKLLDAAAFSHRDDDAGGSEDGISDFTPLLTNLACAGAMSSYWPTMVMCQMLFPGRSGEELMVICDRLRARDDDLFGLIEDDRYLAIMRWAKKIGQDPAAIAADDLSALSKAGLNEKEIARVSQTAAVQAHFAMCCSAAGVEEVIEGFLLPVMKFVERDEFANGADEFLTCRQGSQRSSKKQSGAKKNEADNDASNESPFWNSVCDELGWVPNLFEAVRLSPEYKDRHIYALKVLDRPQTDEFSRRHHAIARYLVCQMHECSYFQATTEQNLIDLDGGEAVLNALQGENDGAELSKQDELVASLTKTLTCHAHKTTKQDVATARSIMEWSDAGFVDFMNTVAIQDSFCRLSMALGVASDDRLLKFPN